MLGLTRLVLLRNRERSKLYSISISIIISSRTDTAVNTALTAWRSCRRKNVKGEGKGEEEIEKERMETETEREILGFYPVEL